MPHIQLTNILSAAIITLCLVTTASADCQNKADLDRAARTAPDLFSRTRALEIAARECPDFNFQYRLALAYQQQDRFDEAMFFYNKAIEASDGSLLAVASSLGRMSEIGLAKQDPFTARVMGNGAIQLFLLRKQQENQPAPDWFNAVATMLAKQDWADAHPEELASLLRSEQTMAHTSLRAVKVVPSIDLRIQFDTDSAYLTREGHDQALRLAKALQLVTPEGNITVIGHTDIRGTDTYNQKLSEQRAQTLADELRKTLPEYSTRIRIEGHGSKEPLLEGDDPATLALNRRVEIRLDN